MRTLLDLYTGTLIGGLPLNILTFALLMAACWIYALWRGGAPERSGAAILLIGYALTAAVISQTVITYESVTTGIFVVDLMCLAAFVMLALRADRFWPLWVAALQLLTVAAHIARYVDPQMFGRAYAFLIIVWSYPMVFVMIVGTWRHRGRLSGRGYDEAWLPRNWQDK